MANSLQQRLDEADKQYKAEQELQSQTWATTARGHLGDLQAFKTTLETFAAKADQNGEIAQLMATGKQLVTSLESVGGDDPMGSESAQPGRDSLAKQQLEALEAFIPPEKRAEWEAQKEQLAKAQPEPQAKPPVPAAAAPPQPAGARGPPPKPNVAKKPAVPAARLPPGALQRAREQGPGRGKGARAAEDADDADDRAEERRGSRSPREVPRSPAAESEDPLEAADADARAADDRFRS